MPRALYLFGLALLLLTPAVSAARATPHVRGAVTAKDVGRSFVTVSSPRRAHVLRVPTQALPRIHLRQQVELRGSTLRSRGRGPTRVLARNVTLIRSTPLAPKAEDEELEDENEDEVEIEEDELEVEGTLTSLSPLTVTANGAPFTCAVPSGFSLAGFSVGDRVEMQCERVGGIQTLRKLELEDEDDDSSGPGHADDDGHDSSGHGGDDGGSSGPGGGSDGGGGDD